MSPKLKQLISLLSDGQYHSGEVLAKALHITRGGIWKLCQELINYGIDVEARSRVGYRIPGGLDLLNEAVLRSHLTSKLFPASPSLITSFCEDFCDKVAATGLQEVIQSDKDVALGAKTFVTEGFAKMRGFMRASPILFLFDSIPSTNTWLKENLYRMSTKNVWCLAEHQTAGRGRMGRTWQSPFGSNLYLSGLWHFQNDLSQISGLSLVLAIATIEALKSLKIDETIQIKWPNDIYCHQAKLAGILVETSGEFHHMQSVIMGIGLNLSMPDSFQTKIDKPWITLKQLTKKINFSKSQLAATLINHWVESLELFGQYGFDCFYQRFQNYDLNFNKEVTLLLPNQEIIRGISRSIDTKGLLQIEIETGEIKRFACGEISLR